MSARESWYRISRWRLVWAVRGGWLGTWSTQRKSLRRIRWAPSIPSSHNLMHILHHESKFGMAALYISRRSDQTGQDVPLMPPSFKSPGTIFQTWQILKTVATTDRSVYSLIESSTKYVSPISIVVLPQFNTHNFAPSNDSSFHHRSPHRLNTIHATIKYPPSLVPGSAHHTSHALLGVATQVVGVPKTSQSNPEIRSSGFLRLANRWSLYGYGSLRYRYSSIG